MLGRYRFSISLRNSWVYRLKTPSHHRTASFLVFTFRKESPSVRRKVDGDRRHPSVFSTTLARLTLRAQARRKAKVALTSSGVVYRSRENKPLDGEKSYTVAKIDLNDSTYVFDIPTMCSKSA